MVESVNFPQILIAVENPTQELQSALPLEDTRVVAQITGPLASVAVTQRFSNPLKNVAELDYLFPLPAEAAVTDFEIVIGERRVQGELQETQAARATFEAAQNAGQRSGLFEQRRPNLFALRLANVQPGEQIEATLRYQERIKFDDDSYEFVFPMGITPKYDRPQHPEESAGVHAPLARADEKIGPVEIQVSVDAGVNLTGTPFSPSHPLRVTHIDARHFAVSLDQEQIPDHDFVLRYAVVDEKAAVSAWVSAEPEAETFLVCLLPPRLEEDVQPEAREFVFVLDRSGSMSGEPIAQARNALRACLRTLNPQDSFRILLFDHEITWYRSEPVAVNQMELDAADGFLAEVQGRGGTDIIHAIEAALQAHSAGGRIRYVVFLTDGAVSAEERALEQVRSLIGETRLFTFGIGPSVNRALLSRMAALGRGRAEFLQLDEDIEGAVIHFQDSVSFPLITDLKLGWSNAKAWDIYPASLPDLYAGQTLTLSGRLARKSNQISSLTVRGKRAGQPIELRVDLPAPDGRNAIIGRLWAQARLEDLNEKMALNPAQADKLRAEIIGLALAQGLVSAYTSFVAVDQARTERDAGRQVIQVAVPLPKGLSPAPFAGQPPSLLRRPAPSKAMPSSNIAASPASFMRTLKGRLKTADSAAMPRNELSMDHGAMPAPSPAVQPSLNDRESGLRWLARTQNLNGTWNDDFEQTAVALLAFLRGGNTARSGSFRTLMRRGLQWLNAAQPQGWHSFLRAYVLSELAARSSDEKDVAAAQAARSHLPDPVGLLEEALLGKTAAAPSAIQSLDDLRLAAIVNATGLAVPPNLLTGAQAALVQTWAILQL